MIFIHLCERYLGIALRFNLWWALYCHKGYPSNDHPIVGADAAFSLRQGRQYLDFSLRDNNKGWNKEWFVVANPSPSLPIWTGPCVGV